MMKVDYKEITKGDLDTYKDLILPMIYEELSHEEKPEENYICLAACVDDIPAGAIVTLMNNDGSLTLLSIWTDQRYRRQGIASGLLQKMTYVAYRLYDWEMSQYGDDVQLRAMYRLSERYKKPLEAWLMKNDFTDFAITQEGDEENPSTCVAMAEIHFFRTA